MNFADAARAQRGLEAMGFAHTPDPRQADVLVLITCVVRQSAENKVIGHLSSLKNVKRHNPDALFIVMGCFVGDRSALGQRYPYVDAFVLPSDTDAVLQLARQRFPGAARAQGLARRETPVAAMVPISEGCDHHCTYCIVTLRRGPQRSRPLSDIVAEVRDWVERGARQVTLLGQNVDAYGQDWPSQRPDLADVLRAVHDIDGLWRIRFLTSHPGEMTDGVIQAVAELSRVCPHFELPVQAGDNTVLKRMGRNYTVGAYRALIAQVRSKVQGCSIATDVIVGFPGETRRQFQATYDLLTEMRFDAVHIAKYSPRPGTPATRLEDDVLPEEKERRRAMLEALQKRIAGEINAALYGQRVEVLTEGRQRHRWMGRTVTNKLVYFEDSIDRRGQLVDVQVTWTGPWSLVGQPTDDAFADLSDTGSRPETRPQ
jgi:tRNA-2-methylthio-N6-dimethylallyladenosine synthase